ncbi:MAG: hypothetical protein D3903_11895 [Candidatus Electrothrix sp. GM3_4]|nr:hypothetical protein [Candidatus Electrothrix sp. GM3_4]
MRHCLYCFLWLILFAGNSVKTEGYSRLWLGERGLLVPALRPALFSTCPDPPCFPSLPAKIYSCSFIFSIQYMELRT